MTTADAVRDDTTPEEPAKPEQATGSGATGSEATGPGVTGPGAPRRLAPSSTVPPAAWLLRSSAIAAAVAGILAAIVAPGVQGNASEHVVVLTVWGASAFAFFLLLLLVTLAVWGAVELLRVRRVSASLRGRRSSAAAPWSWRCHRRACATVSLLVYSSIIAIAAVIAALAGAYAAAGAPHTRAVAAVLAAARVRRHGALRRVVDRRLCGRHGERATLLDGARARDRGDPVRGRRPSSSPSPG